MVRRKVGSSRFLCQSSHRVHLRVIPSQVYLRVLRVPPQQGPLNCLEAIQRGVETVGSVFLLMDASGALGAPAERH